MAQVLIAEDDDSFRELVVELIRARGHEVRALSTGGQLLVELARTLQRGDLPDMIISDVQMPVVSGLELAAALREARRNVAVVLMTAFPDDRVRARVQRIGAHLLAKPFRVEELVELVDRYLDRAPSGTSVVSRSRASHVHPG